jgi:hypothetical protein
VFLQIFDVATAAGVTLGTTPPKISVGFAASSANGWGPATIGYSFANGVQVAITTTSTGSTAPATAADCFAGFQ